MTQAPLLPGETEIPENIKGLMQAFIITNQRHLPENTSINIEHWARSSVDSEYRTENYDQSPVPPFHVTDADGNRLVDDLWNYDDALVLGRNLLATEPAFYIENYASNSIYTEDREEFYRSHAPTVVIVLRDGGPEIRTRTFRGYDAGSEHQQIVIAEIANRYLTDNNAENQDEAESYAATETTIVTLIPNLLE